MPSSKKNKSVSSSKKGTQRKLDFEGNGDDDEVVPVEDAPVTTRKRSSVNTAAAGKESKRRRGIDAYLSPTKSSKKPVAAAAAASVITPEQPANNRKKPEMKQTDEYVPTYIHKNVDYKRKGKSSKDSSLSASTLQVFSWIEENCEIPDDLEQSRVHGPLSGTTYEERVITAYRLGKLKGPSDTMICTFCAAVGDHDRDDCPNLI